MKPIEFFRTVAPQLAARDWAVKFDHGGPYIRSAETKWDAVEQLVREFVADPLWPPGRRRWSVAFSLMTKASPHSRRIEGKYLGSCDIEFEVYRTAEGELFLSGITVIGAENVELE